MLKRIQKQNHNNLVRELAEDLCVESASTILAALEDLELQAGLPAAGWSLRGKAWLLLDQPLAARDVFASGLNAYPGDGILRLNLAAAQLVLGAATDALEILQSLDDFVSGNRSQQAALLRNRAAAAKQCGRHAQALVDLEALRELEGDSEALCWNLASAYEQVDELAKAALLYRQLLRGVEPQPWREAP